MLAAILNAMQAAAVPALVMLIAVAIWCAP